ncbi:MAG: hypothetical protein NZ750_06565 [Anaerolineae bacterium]|nr:hypothetical protein [Anaerolineae bacterium]MDW8171151.1 hypothetical protein [Anaerolineae bacterium]
MSAPKTPSQAPKPLSPAEVVKKVIDTLQNNGNAELSADTNQSPSLSTISRSRVVATMLAPHPAPPVANSSAQEPTPPTLSDAPWLLEQFFDGTVDLDLELSKRLPNMPMLTTIHTRPLGKVSLRQVATLGTQDGAASLIVEVDQRTQVTHWSFSWAAMLSLRFVQADLSVKDRERWLELMRRPSGGLAFLWSAQRWQRDYLIWVVRRNHTNLYAFSPNHFEAAVRLSPPCTQQLVAWLGEQWQAPVSANPSETPPDLSW